MHLALKASVYYADNHQKKVDYSMNTDKHNWGRSFPLTVKSVSRTISISFCSGGLQLNIQYILVFSVYRPQSPASSRNGAETLEAQIYI